MTTEERFEIERDVFRKWLERFSSDECVKLLGDVYDAIKYKQDREYQLGRGRYCAN